MRPKTPACKATRTANTPPREGEKPKPRRRETSKAEAKTKAAKRERAKAREPSTARAKERAASRTRAMGPGELVASVRLPPAAPLPEVDPRMQRKRRTERWLAARGLPFIDHLPPIEGEAQASPRGAEEVARRVRVLFAVSAVGYRAYDAEREAEIVALLKAEGTWTHATPRERRFLSRRARSKQSMIDATWALDAIWPLLWALGHVDDADPLGGERTPRQLQPHVPPAFAPIDPLLEGAALRPLGELLDETDRTYRLHWASRPWREPPWRGEGLCSSSLKERHHALNWLVGAGGARSWDDVDTDT